MKKTFDSNWNKSEQHLTQKFSEPLFGHSIEFDYKRDIKCLSKVLQNYNINHTLDLDFILRFLSSYKYEKRMILVHGLEYEYDYKIIKMICEQPESSIRLCTLAMVIDPIELYVRDFYDLLISKQTDENNCDILRKLLEILLALNNYDIQKFKEIYENLFKNSLENDIELIHDKKSIMSKLLIQLLEGKRCEVNAHSISVAKTIAGQLYEVRQGTSDIDSDTYTQLFTRDSFSQLAAIFDIYEDKYGQSIQEAIEHQFKNEIEIKCFQDMVEYIRLPNNYYSKILRQALDEIPIDYKTLIRIIIGHQSKDLDEIKLEYSKIYDETLDKTIEDCIDIPGIKHAFIMIITSGKKLLSSHCERAIFGRRNHSSPTNSRLSPTNSRLSPTNSRLSPTNSRLSPTNSRLSPTNSRLSPIIMGGMEIKHRSQEAIDKLAHILKIKRPH
ncbi:unnamed protein product [Rotaria sordida]|uniref:Annexin n=1 Tax=Rotaria sordida TaxID=392033 RepID=A0A819CZ75_9BILA|nr:unnamed protein product [Rotaria sordida]CAF3829333.1 unnamed protein product [Rotaria sordida]